MTAKMFEILRMTPRERPSTRKAARWSPQRLPGRPRTGRGGRGAGARRDSGGRGEDSRRTSSPVPRAEAGVLSLPGRQRPPWSCRCPSRSAPGESVTVDLDFTLHLPPEAGPLGPVGRRHLPDQLAARRWPSTTTQGWQPTPFIPWHQPFFNEAGIYTARVTLPADQKVACTGAVAGRQRPGRRLAAGRHRARARPRLRPARAAPASQEYTGAGRRRSQVRCLAFPEHEYYARDMVRRRLRGHPDLQPLVRPLSLSGVHHRRVVLRLERQRVRRPGHDRRAHLRHAAPRPAATSSTWSRTRSATSGGTTWSAPTATARPGWTRPGHLLQPPPASTRSTARTTRCSTIPTRPGAGCRTSTATTTATTACTAPSAAARPAPTVQDDAEVRPPRQPVQHVPTTAAARSSA